VAYAQNLGSGLPAPALPIGAWNHFEGNFHLLEKFLPPGRLGGKIYGPSTSWHDQSLWYS
jgi:hypothetical protein